MTARRLPQWRARFHFLAADYMFTCQMTAIVAEIARNLFPD